MAVQIAASLGASTSTTGRVVVRTSTGVLYSVVSNLSTSVVRIYKSTDGTTWTQQDTAHSPTGTVPSMAIDSSDLIHLVYGALPSLVYQTYSTSTDLFGTATTIITPTGVGAGVEWTDITVDSNNVPHIIADVDSGTSTFNATYYNKVSGSWSAGVVLYSPPGGPPPGSITVDGNNIPIVALPVFTTPNNTIVAYLGNANNATSFSSKVVETLASSTGSNTSPSIGVDSGNNIWIAYTAKTTEYVTLIKHLPTDAWTTWQTPVTNSNAGQRASIAINGTDIYVLYHLSGGGIVYDKYDGSAWKGQTTLESGSTKKDSRVRWANWVDNDSGGTLLTNATYYFDAHTSGPTDPNTNWSSDANAFDGVNTTTATSTAVGGTASNYLAGVGTTAPSSGSNIMAVLARVNRENIVTGVANAAVYTDGTFAELLGTATSSAQVTNGTGWGSYVTLTAPTGGWTWAKLQTLGVKLYSTGLNQSSISRAEIVVVSRRAPAQLDYLFDDGSTMFWNSFSPLSVQTLSTDYFSGTFSGGGTFTRTHTTDAMRHTVGTKTHSTDSNKRKAGNTVSHTTSANKKVSGITTTHTTGSSIRKPTVYAIQDTFNDNSTNTSIWNGNFNGSGNGMTETGGRLQITLGGTAGSYSAYVRTTTFDLTGSSVFVQAPTVFADARTNTQMYIKLEIDATNFLIIGKYAGNLYAQKQVAGVDTVLNSIAYNTTNHAWWRVSEHQGTLYFETSTNGTTWLTQYSFANPFAVTALKVSIGAGTFATDSASTVEFDNFDTLAPTVVTKTHSTDSNKKKAGNLVSHTTDANKKVSGTTKFHTTDANKKKTNTVSHTTSSNKKKAGLLVSHTTDANKKKTLTVSHTTDSNKKKAGLTRTHTTDSLKRTQTTKTHTTDSLKRKQFTLTHSTDSNKKKAAITVTHTTDANKKRTSTVSHTTDSNKKKTGNLRTHTTDSTLVPATNLDQKQTNSNLNMFFGDGNTKKIAQQFIPGTTGRLDKVIAAIGNAFLATDNAIMELWSDNGSDYPGSLISTSTTSISGTSLDWHNAPVLFTFDFSNLDAITSGSKYFLVFNRTGAQDNSNDWMTRGWTTGGVLGVTRYLNSSDTWVDYGATDVMLYQYTIVPTQVTRSHSTDSFKRRQVAVTHTTDANKKKTNLTRSHTTDANKKEAGNLVSHTTDSFKRQRLTLTHTTDSYLRPNILTATRTHTTDALKRKQIAITHTTDSNKKRTSTVSHTTSANKKKTGILVTHTTDSLKRKQFTLVHTTDTNKKKTTLVAHTTDALKRKQSTVSHTTDSNKKKTLTVSHTTDANKKKSGLTRTHTTDSFLRRQITKTHTTDALKRTQTTKTHTTDSLKRTQNTRAHTTDSLKRKQFTLVHSTDSNKRKTTLVSHTTDANRRRATLVSHTTDAFIDTGKRYWVGGTAAWDGTAGTKWAAVSGGTGGFSVPTAANDVYFDGNSGSGTVTLQTAVGLAGSVNMTGFTGTFVQNQNLNLGSATAGNFILGSGMTFTWTAGTVKLISTQTGNVVNTNGKSIGSITFNGAGASWTLQNNLTLVPTALTSLTLGTLDLNGYDFLSDSQVTSSTGSRTYVMNGGRIRLRGTGALWATPAGTLTFDNTVPGNIVIEDTSASTKSFSGGTVAYPSIEVLGAPSDGALTFAGAFSTQTLKFNPDANIIFTAGVTTTATALNWVGTSGHTISVQSTSSGSAATISVASGIVSADYLVLKDSAATGGATFYAGNNSTNVSGNSGWIFSAPPVTYTKTHTTDAFIRSGFTSTHTTDSLKRKQNTKTHTTDANKKKSGNLRTHTTDALKRKQFTASHTTDAFKRKQLVLTHSTDSFKRRQIAVSHTTDANKKRTYSVTHTTDSNKRKSGLLVTHTTDANKRKANLTVFHTTSANKRKAITVVHTTDSFLRKQNTRSHTTDANKKKALSVFHTADANKRKALTVSHTTDANKKKAALTRTHTTDALLRIQRALTHTTNSLLRRQLTLTHTTNSFLRKGNQVTHTTDANKKRTTTVSHTTDANKKKTGVLRTHTTDALLRRQLTKVHTTDSFKRTQNVRTHTTDSLKRTQNTRTHTTDANKRKQYLASHTTDANKKLAGNLRTHTTDSLKRKQFTVTHTTDSLKRRQLTLTHTTDSFLRRQIAKVHTTDSFLRKQNIRSHTTDANKKRAYTVTHTTDANKRKTGLLISHTTDANKRKTLTVSHTTNALLRKAFILTHTTNALLRKAFTLTHTTSANKRKTTLVSHTTDANKKVSGFLKTHTTDANKRKTLSVSHTTNSLLRKAFSIFHTTDSNKRRTTTVSHTTDSYRRGKNERIHTTDANLRRPTTVSHTTDSNRRKALTVSHTTSSMLRKQRIVSHTTDALVHGDSFYTREQNPVLPTDSAPRSIAFSATDMGTVQFDDSTYVDQFGAKYLLFYFERYAATNRNELHITWNGKSTIDTMTRPAYLELYNVTTGIWETLDMNNSTVAGTDFTLSAIKLTGLSDYYDVGNKVVVRAYQ